MSVSIVSECLQIVRTPMFVIHSTYDCGDMHNIYLVSYYSLVLLINIVNKLHRKNGETVCKKLSKLFFNLLLK